MASTRYYEECGRRHHPQAIDASIANAKPPTFWVRLQRLGSPPVLPNSQQLEAPRSSVVALSAITSLSSGVFLGSQIASLSGLPSPTFWIPFSLQNVSNTFSITETIPRTARMALTLHFYAMTTLSIHKTMGRYHQSNLVSAMPLLVALIGSSLIASSEDTWAERAAGAVTVLPLFISLCILFAYIILCRQLKTPTTGISDEKG
ncbi:hypothetical protein M426DRAFT_319578 [Hypoxylon sp. CI-4A]|nr:hypothetical protein M426DRAFT_319578 [Hypoxylon sp. CI-4A]